MEHNLSSPSLENQLFFKVEGVKISDLYDWSTEQISVDEKDAGIPLNQLQTLKQERNFKLVMAESASSWAAPAALRCGRRVDVNLFEVALFRLHDKVYAIQEKCPHAGGPLHVGDLEDWGPGQMCVKCPYHGWKFDLKTGACIHPRQLDDNAALVYPVRVNPNDGTMWVGFAAFNQEYFKEPVW